MSRISIRPLARTVMERFGTSRGPGSFINFQSKLCQRSFFFPYIPLNGGTTQFVLERSKVEYKGFRHFNVGAGYAAYKDFSLTAWQNKPFASLTWKSPNLGQFEVWFQALPDNGFQFQSPHMFTWKSRH